MDRFLLTAFRFASVVLVAVTVVGVYNTRNIAEGTLLVAIGGGMLYALYRVREF